MECCGCFVKVIDLGGFHWEGGVFVGSVSGAFQGDCRRVTGGF